MNFIRRPAPIFCSTPPTRCIGACGPLPRCREARDLQKPILLSIGYAACHWCHVMAHESFEDPATAEVMNELFVNIKVDREERPDIDHIYMTSLHAFGQQGGWPLTMFLTPEGEAFWGGTYFPKVAHYGRPAFVSVLRSVAAAFRAEPGRITANARAIRASLTQSVESASRAKTAELSLELLNDLAPRLANLVDLVNGGLRGAPKFPNAPILEFLWRAGARLQRAPYRELVRLTLTRMSEGGIYDHLGGGYARYSTDERWLVPHFEKMLYDNAQILELLALCHGETGDELFRTCARETVVWLRREMTHRDGAFCASLDADSEGAEGKFYVWTWEELTRILGRGRGLLRGIVWGRPNRQLVGRAFRDGHRFESSRRQAHDAARRGASRDLATKTFRGARATRPPRSRR